MDVGFNRSRLGASIRTVYLFLLCVVAPSAALEQSRPNTQYTHTGWTAENGIGAVFDIQQSLDGYLWLTTSKALFASMEFDLNRRRTQPMEPYTIQI